MGFLALCLAAVGLPYAVERLYLKRRFGIFALLFWIFIAQSLVLAGAWLAARSGLGDGGVIGELGAFLAGASLLTLAFAPLAAFVAAVAFLGVWGFDRLASGRGGR